MAGPILARLGLAPAVGLGNVAMILMRVRAAIRAAEPDAALPLVRVLGHHSQVAGVMQACMPAQPGDRCRDAGTTSAAARIAAAAMVEASAAAHFTAGCSEAVADLDPGRAALPISDLQARAARLDTALA